MRTEQIRLRLTDDETALLRELAGRCGLQPTALAAVFVRAALHAVAHNAEHIPMPLRFEIAEADKNYSLNDAPALYKPRK